MRDVGYEGEAIGWLLESEVANMIARFKMAMKR
jgi:hypothetical protein